MDATPAPAVPKIYPWLPYWAVLQTDVGQTLRSWVYRFWVFASLAAAIGFLLYRFGVYREAGLVQSAALHVAELATWTIAGSLSLVAVLAVGAVAAERGNLADSVLSRGISRSQYFLAKWHARLAVVLGTYLVLGAVTLVGSYFLLHVDLTLTGSLLAMGTMLVVLGAVVSCGVAVGAMTNNTVVGIAGLWVVLYGAGLVLSRVPAGWLSPERLLSRLPDILKGECDTTALGWFVGTVAAAGLVAGIAGLVGFARRDL
jgi:ABC-2 type transport system permease protein